MGAALASAGITAAQVDYINAHGTSTPHGDKVETIAIKRCFGEYARRVAVSSTKSMTGHLLGAAGGLEAGVTVLAVYNQVVPPTINLDHPDAECDLDYVPNVKRRAQDPVRAVQFVRLRRHERRAAVQAVCMKLAVCLKQVPTRDWQPRLDDARTWIREPDASFEMNEPDAYALEEALRLKEKHGGEVVVCSAGPARAAQVLREALARGADRAIHVEDDRLASADAFVVARALAAAMKDERFDLVLAGLQSDDQGFAQTGVILAEYLGRPHATIVMEVQIDGGGDTPSDPSGTSDRSAPLQPGTSREAGARGRLLPVGLDAAAGGADHSERHQPAALRDAQRDHGGEEERDPESRGARRRRAAPEDPEPLRPREEQEDADDRRIAGRSRERSRAPAS